MRSRHILLNPGIWVLILLTGWITGTFRQAYEDAVNSRRTLEVMTTSDARNFTMIDLKFRDEGVVSWISIIKVGAEPQPLKMPLSSAVFDEVSLNFFGRPGRIVIHSIWVVEKGRTVRRRVDGGGPSAFRITPNATAALENGKVVVEIPEDIPYGEVVRLDYKLPNLHLLPPAPPGISEGAYTFGVGGALGAVLLFGLVGTPGFSRWLGRAGLFCQGHPVLMIWAVAGLSTSIAMWPIFVGNALVGPYDQVQLLYDADITLPGQKQAHDRAATGGSDIGAILLSGVGAMKLIIEGIPRGELLLWDRFQSSGYTYIGQGQFLYASPFMWPGILLGGGYGAWNVIFWLSRLLMCAFFGLYLRRLGVATPLVWVSTVVAAFVGMFLYRSGHFAAITYCAFPLILFGVDGMISMRPGDRRKVLYGLCLLLGYFSAVNSGALKEAVFLSGSATAIALGLRMFGPVSWKVRGRMLLETGLVGLVFVLLESPILLAFLDSLKSATTIYDIPVAEQQKAWLWLGIFDVSFIRYGGAAIRAGLPSANLVFLPGLLFAIVAIFRLKGWRILAIPLAAAVIGTCLAFEIIPGEPLLFLPFINKLTTFYNSFGIAALPGIMVGGVLGWQYWYRHLRGDWFALALVPLTLLIIMVTAGREVLETSHLSAWQRLAMVGAMISSVALPVLAEALRVGWGRWKNWQPLVLGLVVMLVAFLCHRAIYMRSAAMAPTFTTLPELVDLQPSPAVEWLLDQTRREPGRVMGTTDVLTQGLPPMFGLETIAGGMPVRSHPYWDFIYAIPNWRIMWDWQLRLEAEHYDKLEFFFRMVNCRYVVSMPGQRWEAGVPAPVHRSDLEIVEVEGTWPRAFYSDKVEVLDGAVAVMIRARDSQQPVASVPEVMLKVDPRIQGLVVPGPEEGKQASIVAARDYELTYNTTAFTIDAPGPGLVCLQEVLQPNSFEVTVNGEPVPLVATNHAFRGTYVPAAGTYRIVYTYAPPSMYLGLKLAAGGLLLLGAIIGVNFYLGRRGFGAENARDAGPLPALVP